MDAEQFAASFEQMRSEIGRAVVAQNELVDGLLTAVCAGGHVLIEGAPGLGKTLVARAFAQSSGCAFKRIQFTPDLMPSDVTGSSILDRQKSAFTFVRGPVFANVVLADEINRAPAKTQSALLEAMQERQVSVDGIGHALPGPFMVIATQNPIESQGTYPLPEAQLDRFLFKLVAPPPAREHEQTIVRQHAEGFDPNDLSAVTAVLSPEHLLAMQAFSRQVRIDDAVIAYLVDIVRRTRQDRAIEVGASPRASLALLRGAQVTAACQGRTFVTPDDVKPLVRAALRHRIILHADAQLEGITADAVIDDVLRATTVPKGA